MGIIQSARMSQFFRRLASLKESFVPDLQDTLLPTLELMRQEAPDLARHRGEDLWSMVLQSGAVVGANSWCVFAPTFGNAPGGRLKTVSVIEQLSLSIGLAGTTQLQLALYTDAIMVPIEVFPVPSLGMLTDARGTPLAAVGNVVSRSQTIGATGSAVLPAGNLIDLVNVNGGGSQPTVIWPLKLVLFPGLQLVVLNTTANQGLNVTARGYERFLEVQEAV